MKKFSPLLFLASLGAGGIAVSGFAFFNYTFPHAKGLIKYADVHQNTLNLAQTLLFTSIEAIMLIFIALHLVLSVIFAIKLFKWIKTEEYKNFLQDPLQNAGILAPFISIFMTLNVFIGAVRYFVPYLALNLQKFMLAGLIFWGIFWLWLMFTEIKLLKISFLNSFDVSKIHFGWLLHPFALGMATVTGTGIAAMAQNSQIADIAFFLSLISGTMGLFLLLVKAVAIFKSHFAQNGLPEKQFLPSMLIIIPNITLYAISAFRIGHYLETHQGFHMGAYFLIVMTTAFAFEVWYLAFGLSLLATYLKKDFFKEFFISQWGLICPLVAFAVLGSFVYNLFSPNMLTYITLVATIAITVSTFFFLLLKQMRCAQGSKKLICA